MDRQQQKILQEHGIAWEVMTKGIATQPKATFYNRDGTPLPNLPADAYSLRRYLARGLTLTPPENPVVAPVAKETIYPIVEEILPQHICETCGKPFLTKFALAGHNRSHNKSKQGGKR